MKRMRISIFLSIALVTAVAASPKAGPAQRLDPRVGQTEFDDGEFLIDTSITPARAYGSNPAVASDGTNLLVVWSDTRKGNERDIFGMLVRPDGTLLDSAGIAITTARGNDLDPAVAFNGTSFLVVWTDDSSGVPQVYGARVALDGTVLDPAAIPIAVEGNSRQYPAVGSDGQNFLVAWTLNSTDEDICAARVAPDGTVLDPEGIPICAIPGGQSRPAVAYDGADYLLVWMDDRNTSDIYGTRVSPAGAVLDSAGIAISTTPCAQTCPAIAPDSAGWLVVWEDDWYGTPAIFGARVTRDGVVRDTLGILISEAASYQNRPAVARESTSFLVAWRDQRSGVYQIFGARVSTAGQLLDSSGIAIAVRDSFQENPAITSDGANFRVAWDASSAVRTGIFTSRVSPAGAVLDSAGIEVSFGTSAQRSPAVAHDGANFLAVWQDYRYNPDCDICAARVSPSGVVLDPAGIPVSTAANDQLSPTVAFGGTGYFAVWQDGRTSPYRLFGARITPAGQVLDTQGIALIGAQPSTQSLPAIAFGNSDYLLAWQDVRNWHGDIYAARVNQAGVVLDTTGIAVATGPDLQYSPAIAFDGANFLVAWSNLSGSSDIFAARVTLAGQVLDSAGIVVSNAAHNQSHPAVAFDGANFLVVWDDLRNDSFSCVYGARIRPDGQLLDSAGIRISAGPAREAYPSVVRDGANSLVVWTDYRGGADASLWGAHVSPGGAVLDSFLVVSQPGPRWVSALARGPGGQVFLAYDGWAGNVEDRSYNNARIWGKLGPFGGIAEGPVPATPCVAFTPGIVRGVLNLRPTAPGRRQAALLDIAGRAVFELQAGPNDVSRLAPGVYFVVPARAAGQAARRVSKVILSR
jgi:large repetitive protein